MSDICNRCHHTSDEEDAEQMAEIKVYLYVEVEEPSVQEQIIGLALLYLKPFRNHRFK